MARSTVPMLNGLGRPGGGGDRRPSRSCDAPDTTIFVPADWSVTFTDAGLRGPQPGAGHVRRQITEYLEIDLDTEQWHVRQLRHRAWAARGATTSTGAWCGSVIPREVHRPIVDGAYTFAPDPRWCRILEFICPGCATLIEVEYLPPGHPVTHDIETRHRRAQASRARARGGRAMSSSVEIDIGGTFTDCYVRLDDREVWCKARTTPFDLSQGLSRAIDDAARAPRA